jgi:hypothetical protein
LSSSSAAQPNCNLTRVLQQKVCKQKAKLIFVANQMENSALKQISEYKFFVSQTEVAIFRFGLFRDYAY